MMPRASTHNGRRENDQREQAQDRRFVDRCSGSSRDVQGLAERVERARADVAVDDPDGADDEQEELITVAGRFGRRVAGRGAS